MQRLLSCRASAAAVRAPSLRITRCNIPHRFICSTRLARTTDSNPLPPAMPAAPPTLPTKTAADSRPTPTLTTLEPDASTQLSTEKPPSAAASASPASDATPLLPCPPAESTFVSSVCEFQSNLRRLSLNQPLNLPTAHRTTVRDDEVFANADLPLARINAYGFDYDYTLASYNDSVSELIYKGAQRYLVERMGYPNELMHGQFDKNFAIRGLHFDTNTGFILKVDQFAKVQTSTVWRGRRRVPLNELIDAYRGVSLTRDYQNKYLHQMVDLFALSETNLLADTVQVFRDKELDFSPDYVHRDIRRAIDYVHSSGELHNAIIANPGSFLEPHQKLAEYLLQLRAAGKFTFLLTNSPFAFVDAGMKYMLHGIASLPAAKQCGIASAAQWRELFDVTICSARKPTFFTREGHFRRIDPDTNLLSWLPVRQLKRGEIYTEGSLVELCRQVTSVNLARGSEVVYFGDHVAADLTAPWKAAKWRTVAIVRELSHEIAVQSTPEFKCNLQQLLRIEALINYGQQLNDEETTKAIAKLKRQRTKIKKKLLEIFNPAFGSVFRTSSNRTEFFFSVSRFADVYTSAVQNFLNYSLSHCFYSARQFWPHEIHTHADEQPMDGTGECGMLECARHNEDEHEDESES